MTIPELVWNHQLLLGVPAIDRDHRQIVQLISDMRRLLRCAASRSSVQRVFLRLMECTLAHFREEEAHMAAIGFPGRESHIAAHTEMLAELESYRLGFQRGGTREPADAHRFLVYWWAAHIRGLDEQYACFERDARSCAADSGR